MLYVPALDVRIHLFMITETGSHTFLKEKKSIEL